MDASNKPSERLGYDWSAPGFRETNNHSRSCIYCSHPDHSILMTLHAHPHHAQVGAIEHLSMGRALRENRAAMSVKRKRGAASVSVTRSQPRKRRRVESHSTSHQQTLQQNDQDGLRWREVQFPNTWDDAEGFFGLEEIDNVEVLGDIAAGKATFRDLRDPTTAAGSAEVQAQEANEDDQEEEEEEEWGGLEDIENEGGSPAKLVQEALASSELMVLQENVEASESSGGEDSESLEHFIDEPLDADTEPPPLPAWKDVELLSSTSRALRRLGFDKPTPIQEQAIPPILNGKDVIGKAVTGSGKTLAYTIPIWQSIQQRVHDDPQKGGRPVDYPLHSLVLAPTRELARQIGDHMTALWGNAVRLAVLTGGLSLQKQLRLLRISQVVIATPGRLWEMLESHADFAHAAKKMQFLVVDEADRLLADGHFEELSKIMDVLNKKEESTEDYSGLHATGEPAEDHYPLEHRQTLVFSATLSKSLQKRLASNNYPQSFANDTSGPQTTDMSYLLAKLPFDVSMKPLFIDVNPDHQLATQLQEGILECGGMEKDLYLYSLILLNPTKKTLIFTNSISAVRRLASMLQALNLSHARALHSQMSQQARLRAMERFSALDNRNGLSPGPTLGSILVATDVAARGLDIPSVELVIHYHVPRTADTYIHRSGRTARSFHSGTSILLCSPDENAPVRRLISTVHSKGPKHLNSSCSSPQKKKRKRGLQSFDVDRRIPARLKPRIELAAKIAKSEMGDERARSEDQFLRTAAEELGVDYDSEEFAQQAKRGKGRGKTRLLVKGKGLDREETELSMKADVRRWRAELRELLARRVNVGVSETYITRGMIDLNALLEINRDQSEQNGIFLGKVDVMSLA